MPKLTNKQRDQQIVWLTNQIRNLNSLLATYIEFKEDSVGFQKHLVDVNEELKKKAENDSEINSEVGSKEG